mgnify:CR=1 FL=1
MLETLTTAVLIGFAGGMNPGPLSILVIQQTLQQGLWEGVKAAMVPFVTDGPIILLSVGLLGYFSGNLWFMAVISVVGGLYLLYLGSKMLLFSGIWAKEGNQGDIGLRQMVKVNFLNPNPYLFWTTVGGAYIVGGQPAMAAVFIFALLLTVVGTKSLIAFLTSVFREQIRGQAYAWVTRGLGLVLGLYGLIYLQRAYLAVLA